MKLHLECERTIHFQKVDSMLDAAEEEGYFKIPEDEK